MNEEVEGILLALIHQQEDWEKSQFAAKRLKRNPLSCFSRRKTAKPKDYSVDVVRTGFGRVTLVVEDAVSQRDAAEKALDMAGSTSFSDYASKYEADGLTPL